MPASAVRCKGIVIIAVGQMGFGPGKAINIMTVRQKSGLFNRISPVPPEASGRTFAEFFAGIGLVRMGLEKTGWSIRFANDMDTRKLRMYEDHFGESPYYSTDDIHEIAKSPDRVPDVILAHASFPCTDLSVAGARRGIHAGESSAFWGFHKLLEVLGDRRPPLILLENVVGFMTSHGGDDFRSALMAMNQLGYQVDPFMVDAAHFVPQSRSRLFVVCKLNMDEGHTLAIKGLKPSPLRSQALIDIIQNAPEINWSIRVLPDLPPYGRVRLKTILDKLPMDSDQWWNSDRADYLLNQMSERHRGLADQMIVTRKWSYGSVFRRVRKGRSMAELRTDGIAGCLRTPKGGSGRQILFQAGYGRYKVRLLNPDECAKLMGADGFRVKVPLNQALFGFGDAVCVDAIDWIARHYLNPLADMIDKTNVDQSKTDLRAVI